MYEQIEREVEMDKFFRRGKYSTNVNPETGEFYPPSNEKRHRCEVLKRYCPSMTMDTFKAVITQRVFLSHKGRKFFHVIELETCKREDAPRVYEKHAQAWRLQEESK